MSKKPNPPFTAAVCLLLALAMLFGGVLPGQATYAAAETRQTAGSSTTSIYLPLVSRALVHTNLVKGPTLIYTGSSDSMKIFWQWTSNASFRVDWGTTTAYENSSAALQAYDTAHHLYAYNISGLAPATRYEYRVVVGEKFDSGSFTTAPGAGATTLKFASYGDTRTNPAMHDTVAQRINALYQSDPGYQTIIPFGGDAVNDGNADADWTSEFFNPKMANIRALMAHTALLPVMGNHEGAGSLFKRYFLEPFTAARYWSVDYGPAHFVMLDQYTPYSAGTDQYAWLQSDLAGTGKKWKIVVLHEPGWSAGGGHSNNSTVQNDLQPLFEQYQVAMVLGGHNHYYARAEVNGVQHLTTGTGGAPTVSPERNQPYVVSMYKGYGYSKFEIHDSTLTGWFVDINGIEQDTFHISR